MINPRKKLITGIVLTLFLTAALMGAMVVYNMIFDIGYIHFALDDQTAADKYQGVVQTVRELNGRYEEAYDSFYSLIQVKADMAARACYKVASEGGDACIQKHSKGSVVKIENGNMILPAGSRQGLLKYSDRITGDRGTLIYDTPTMNGVRKDILVYSHVKGPYYYVEITNGREAYDHVSQYVGVFDILNGLEYVNGMTAVLICPHHENSHFFFCYPSDMVYNGEAVAEGGDHEYSNTVWDPNQISGTGVMSGESGQMLQSYVSEDIDELDCKLVLVFPETDTMVRTLESSVVGNVVSVMLCIVFIVYITSIYEVMFRGVVTNEKKTRYAPAKVKGNAVSYGIVSFLTVFAVCIFIRSLSNLYQETGNMRKTLNTLEWRLLEVKTQKQVEDQNRKTLYTEYGQRLAELLEKYPHLNEKENLKVLSDTVGARYIMLYDAFGRESGTSSDYIGMELGAEDAQTSTSDFRRILKGVPSIVHDPVRDEVTGRTLELVGVRTNDLKNGGYGVLILAMNPVDGDQTVEEEINSAIKSMTGAEKLCFSVDPGTGEVVYTGFDDYDYYQFYASDFGLKAALIRDGVSDFITIGGKKFYCISDSDSESGLIHYSCIQTDTLFGKGIGYAVTCAIGFGIVFALLCMYLLRGYTEKAVEEAEKREQEPFAGTKMSGGFLAKAKALLSHKWGSLTPEEKALMTLRVILSIAILNLVIDYYRRSGNTNGEFVLDYILSGTWNKGVNLFALTAMVILLCGVALLMFFVRFVLGTVGSMMSPRGQTICKLIANMIGYLSIILYLYYALSYLGVNTNAILASVGVMSLGLTMGARDLISDILSGISLIFEGEYQMGDIVSIDGYRGMVQEVGVRTTKLEGRGGNIKTVRNSDVKNVINLTKLNSWVPVTIKVDVNYPLRDVEEILTQTLPQIGENCKEIISGPYYKGVISVEMGFAVLSIIAECRESDFHQVERTLVRDVLMALRDKNVPVR